MNCELAYQFRAIELPYLFKVVDLPDEGLPTRPINGSRGMMACGRSSSRSHLSNMMNAEVLVSPLAIFSSLIEEGASC